MDCWSLSEAQKRTDSLLEMPLQLLANCEELWWSHVSVALSLRRSAGVVHSPPFEGGWSKAKTRICIGYPRLQGFPDARP